MKAIVCTQYGSPDVLQLQEVPTPVPADDEVLIKVYTAALNAADWHIMRADPLLVRFMFGFKKPKYEILGSDVAGRVEAVGARVTKFKVGDEVFGNLFTDGGSRKGMGAFAEYACAREIDFAHKPENLSWEEAAAIPLAGVTAIQALRTQGEIKAGQKVLIDGASGGVGTFAVQLAKAFNTDVTAVTSTTKVELSRSIGADHVIDYRKEDFTKNGKRYDLIIGANSFHPIRSYVRVLTPKGKFVGVGGTFGKMVEGMTLGPLLSSKNGRRLTFLSAKSNHEDLLFLRNLAVEGKLKPVVDRIYHGLEEIPAAMRYLEERHAKGKIVIRVNAFA